MPRGKKNKPKRVLPGTNDTIAFPIYGWTACFQTDERIFYLNYNERSKALFPISFIFLLLFSHVSLGSSQDTTYT